MDNTEIEKLVWSCIQPAPKSSEPENSDGYDEADVFMAVNRAVQKCIEMWAGKADSWDKLGLEIDRCYTNEDGSENTDPDIDLCTIGEICASQMGYL